MFAFQRIFCKPNEALMFAQFQIGVYYVHVLLTISQNIVSDDTYFECMAVRINMNYGNTSENNIKLI